MTRLALVSLALAAGCVGDNAIRVKGAIQPSTPCILELRASEAAPPLTSRPIQGNFLETLVVSPWRRNHFVAVVCDGTLCASAELGPDYYSVPYDFGEIPSPQ